VMGDSSLRPQWFATMLMLALTGAVTGRYVDFTQAQHAALRMVAERSGLSVSDAGADQIVGAMRRLPPHPDVSGGLEELAAAGLRLVALTNSVLDAAEEQLTSAGIRQRFEAVYSADEVRRLKPAPEPYRMVAERSGVPIEQTWLVAAHAWDISGALAAGCRAAFVARPGMVPSAVGPQPDLIVADIAELAERLPASIS
ncbi:MAG TPA: haloacid dehalogenase type II, partial [Egibacteraceae bacterium]|nr:haloacid dehalogenase type II [Egibacteraceae bacterium]